MYRRDWVVSTRSRLPMCGDWDSDYVKENGHPAVTPLDAALESGNMEGWKENEVTEFTSSQGENPDEDYTDNVIFPSGTSDPLTISDWEWMMEAFREPSRIRAFPGIRTLTVSPCTIRVISRQAIWYLLSEREPVCGARTRIRMCILAELPTPSALIWNA